MTRKESITIKSFFSLVALSGITIYILDTFFKIENEWTTSSHPLLSSAKAVHNLLTPFLILIIGFVIKDHILKRLRKNLIGKRSGLVLLSLFFLLILSGQSLLIINSEKLRLVNQYLHLGLGVGAGLVFIFHLKMINK